MLLPYLMALLATTTPVEPPVPSQPLVYNIVEVAYAEETKEATTTPEFERIAWCESRNVATAKNPNSSARGRFQFIKSTWNYYGKKLWKDDFLKKDILNYQDNTELAWWAYKKNGTSDWLESKWCWDNPVQDG